MYWHVLLPVRLVPPRATWGPAFGLVPYGPAPASFSLHIEVTGDNYRASKRGTDHVADRLRFQFRTGGPLQQRSTAQSFHNFSVNASTAPCHSPALRHRPRRIRPARLAQEAEDRSNLNSRIAWSTESRSWRLASSRVQRQQTLRRSGPRRGPAHIPQQLITGPLSRALRCHRLT